MQLRRACTNWLSLENCKILSSVQVGFGYDVSTVFVLLRGRDCFVVMRLGGFVPFWMGWEFVI